MEKFRRYYSNHKHLFAGIVGAVSILALGGILSLGCSYVHEIAPVPSREHTFSSSENSVTYIGHATALIHLDTINILTDPVLGKHAGMYGKRYMAPGIVFDKLPPIDVILISHSHLDHLDRPTLRRFPKEIPVVVSQGLEDRITKLGFQDVRGLAWWEPTVIRGTTITCVSAQHNWGFSHPSGYVIEGSKTVYFSGDTRFFDGFNEIGRRFTIDLAILLIEEGRFKHIMPKLSQKLGHMLTEEIPTIMEMLRTDLVIPMHWGTFRDPQTSTIHTLEAVIEEQHLEDKILILNIGETKVLSFTDRESSFTSSQHH